MFLLRDMLEWESGAELDEQGVMEIIDTLRHQAWGTWCWLERHTDLAPGDALANVSGTLLHVVY